MQLLNDSIRSFEYLASPASESLLQRPCLCTVSDLLRATDSNDLRIVTGSKFCHPREYVIDRYIGLRRDENACVWFHFEDLQNDLRQGCCLARSRWTLQQKNILRCESLSDRVFLVFCQVLLIEFDLVINLLKLSSREVE